MKNMKNNIFHFGILLCWTSQLSLASYPYYYHRSNLFQPSYGFDPFGFVNPYYQAPTPIAAQPPQLNQPYQIIYLQPAPGFNVESPEYNYSEENENGQQTEAPLARNSAEEDEINYIDSVHRENNTPSQVKSITPEVDEQYHGFTYSTEYQGGGHSNVVFYTGKGSHKLMFPSSQREGKSLSDVALTARTVASDSLDVNSSRGTTTLDVPEFTSKNPVLSSASSSEKPPTTTDSKPTLTDALEDFSAEQVTSADVPSGEQGKKSAEINLTTEEATETENVTTENTTIETSLNATSTLSSIKQAE